MTTRRLTEHEVRSLVPGMHRHDITGEFQHIRRYLDSVESILRNLENDALETHKSKPYTQEEVNEYFHGIQEIEYQHQQVLPKMLLRAQILHLASVVEIKLIMIAEKLKHGTAITLAEYLSTRKDDESARDKIVAYIAETTGVKLNNLKRWSTVKDLFAIRNIIAHDGSILNSSSSKFKNLDTINRLSRKYHKSNGPSVRPSPYLSPYWVELDLSPQFCMYLLNEVEAFFVDALGRICKPPFVPTP